VTPPAADGIARRSWQTGRGRGDQFRRVEILRSPRNGVHVLSDEVV
jgi:hypothetical protein